MSGGGRPGAPVTIRGIEYPSQRAAAKAIGVSERTLSLAARRGRLDRVGTGVNPGPSLPCRWRGVVYPSRAEAARATGEPYSRITRAINAGREE